MCGRDNVEMEQLLKSSIDSYNTDFSLATTSDPIEAKLLHTSMYRPYMGSVGLVHGITMPFYDLRGYISRHTNLSNLLTDWIKRRRGIVGTKNSTGTFTLLRRKNFYEKCAAHTETWIPPNCKHSL